MSDVKLPIVTTREGNKITKVCVEDVYKILNRIIKQMDKSHNNSVDIIDSLYKEVNGYEGSLVIGTGVSQPCMNDAFDEEIGTNLAFIKAKLNANIKKRNFIIRIWNEYINLLDVLDAELEKIESYIKMDLEGVRKHNPEYLSNYEV